MVIAFIINCKKRIVKILFFAASHISDEKVIFHLSSVRPDLGKFLQNLKTRLLFLSFWQNFQTTLATSFAIEKIFIVENIGQKSWPSGHVASLIGASQKQVILSEIIPPQIVFKSFKYLGYFCNKNLLLGNLKIAQSGHSAEASKSLTKLA